ncbi:MAG: ribbon-helix-helix protein, CopG family [Thermovenabulum sp.]|uniref:ribbon-helix-helix protein, CopG family n=1 Tax=Thermovenabulum sp. TaxID=3100335 RepID=UPI003C7E8B1A
MKCDENIKIINIRIPKPLYDEFKEITEKESMNISKLIRKWIEEFVKRNKENI